MAIDLEKIREAAQRVATSHRLDVVDVEMAGAGKHRALRVYIEKNAEGRAKLAAELAQAREVVGTAGPSAPASAGSASGRDDSAVAEPVEGETDAATTETDAATTDTDAATADTGAATAETDTDAPEIRLPDNIEALSGTTHEDCAAFANDFGVMLDVEDLIPGAAEYTLEVSSPGLDRKLKTPADFARFTGGIAKVQTRIAVNGNKHWTGRLLDVTGTEFTLDLSAMHAGNRNKPRAGSSKAGSKGGKKNTSGKGTAPDITIRLDIANVEKASLVPEI